MIEAVAHVAGPERSLRESRQATVRVEDLRKSYASGEDRVDALLGISFEAFAGEVLGVLGPNGAGKTTLIEILEGLRSADSGTATVLGADVNDKAQLRSIRHRMGVAIQETVLPPLLTVEELLRLHAAIFPRSLAPAELIARVGLEEKERARVRQLSGGQQQRLAVALALVGEPELLFLDEPTSQLDPQARRAVWELLLDERKRSGRTILLTTHQMEEAQRLCTRILILDYGKLLAMGTPSELINRYCPGRMIQFTTQRGANLSFLERTLDEAGNLGPGRMEREELGEGLERITLRTSQLERTMGRLMSAGGDGKIGIEDLRMERQTIEDVFLHLTGRRIRD